MSALGSAPGVIVGVGVGEAAGAALDPLVEPAKQDAWNKNQNAILDPGTLAALAAQGGITLGSAQATGNLHGLTPDKMTALYYLAQTVPGLSEALTLYRRQSMVSADFSEPFNHALVKAGLDPQYVPAITALVQNILSPEVVANAVQQGHLGDPQNILPTLPPEITYPAGYAQPTAPDGVAPTDVPLTQIGLDAVQEAIGSGIEFDRLQVLANLAGLPPGPQELLTMWNRNEITEAAVDAGMREGHIKTKWTGALKRMRWGVLSHIQYVDARVRGWIDNAGMYEGGALSGYTPDQLDLLHKTHGRPISWHQVWIGLQRGGTILDPTADLTSASTGIDDTFFKSLQQSDIQQQWYDLAWAQRYTYPSAFVLRQLRESNAITDAMLRDVLKYIGWEPTFIDAVATAWGGAVTTTTQKKQTLTHLTAEYLSGALTEAALTTILTGTLGYTADQAAAEIALAEFNAAKSARTKATNSLEKRYVAAKLTEADARTQLANIGYPAGAIDAFIAAWNVELADTLTTLTVAQIQTALKNNTILASVARPLLEDLGESDAAITTIFATYGTDPNT